MKKLRFSTTIEILTDEKMYYIRTRELAVACGIKQPFAFNEWLKKVGKAVLKGEKTEKFRNKNLDTSQTTFITISDALVIMREHEEHFKKIAPNYMTVLRALEKFVGGYINEKGQIIFKDEFLGIS